MSAQSGSSCSSVTYEDFTDHGNFYDIVFLDSSTQRTQLLLSVEDGTWSLPYFEFANLSLDGTAIPRVSERFRSWLEISDDEIYLTSNVEFMGTRFAESRIDPEKQAASPNPNAMYSKFMLNAIKACLDESREFIATLSDERYQPRWFEKANSFLVECASHDGAKVEGRVVQRHMSISSTMLKVRTSLGSYFLKSPACGCNETKTTGIISKRFHEQSADVVGVCEELNMNGGIWEE